ncbi:MAG: delta-aminolevulinic acid dehydratase [Halioglobus sp.]
MHGKYAFIFILLCAGVLAGKNADAECECIWEGSFSEVQERTDLVVSGTVIEGKGNSIDLNVDQILRGETFSSSIRIWLKTGDYCRPEPALFPEQSRWVLALHQIQEIIPAGFNPNTPNVSYGRIGDYSLSECGGYWLSQSENLVSGNLINAPRWVREPKMTPVLLDVLADYVAGKISTEALLQASTEDPALRELMLDTRAFLRNED